jgi:hypothetical protein
MKRPGGGMINESETAGNGRGRDGAGFARWPPAGMAAGTARNAGAAAHRPVPGTRGRARRHDAGRPGHPCGSRVRGDRRDAGGDRPVHAAAADGRVRRPGFIAPPCRGRGLRHRRHPRRRTDRARGRRVAAICPAGWARGPASRRDAAVCPAGQARVPGEFLSRTVLVGFLTGVGIQVAAGQLPDMLG